MAIYISAKDTGMVALPECETCSWVYMQVDRKPPFQIFPGIFSSFDSLNKRSVHDHFDTYGPPPWWGDDLPAVCGYEKPTRQRFTDDVSGVTVTGEPDAIYTLENEDGVVLADYKTARLTEGQDDLMPVYTVQLNVYAWFRRVLELSPAKYLYLIYQDPQTRRDDMAPADYIRRNPKGYQLDFNAQIVPVELKSDDYIPGLLKKVAKIAKMKKPPKGKDDCPNCARVKRLLALADTFAEGDLDTYCDLIHAGQLAGFGITETLRSARRHLVNW